MVPMVKLNDGRKMPQLGFGLWQVSEAEADTATAEAFRAGYRSIDCASIYKNERGLGEAIKKCGLPRSELFITTKLWNADQGRGRALRALDESLNKLGLPYVDLYLIHWPAPKKAQYIESWQALLQIRNDGRAKSIGVSNFTIDALERIMAETTQPPAVNQIELHPRFQQRELRDFHARHNIVTESWSPLGQGQVLQDPVIARIAEKHGKTPAQVVIRWHLQNDIVVIPKSVTPTRIRENFDVFGFQLDGDDLQQIEALDSPTGRIGPDPTTAEF